MAKQVYYQNLPIPSNQESIPTYLNNELQILGNVIAELDQKIETGGSSTSSIDTSALDAIETEIRDLTIQVNNNQTTLLNEVSNFGLLSNSVSTNTSDINTLNKTVVRLSSYINNIKNDNVITSNQRSELYSNWKLVFNEYIPTMTKAASHGVNSQAYSNAYDALKIYLTNQPFMIDVIPNNGDIWCSDQSDIIIDGVIYRDMWNNYRFQKQLLDNAVIDSMSNKTVWNEINVDGAVMTAEQAAVDASTALSLISSIAGDGYITPGEKSSLFIEWKSIYDEKSGIDTQGTNAGVSITAYGTAYTTLYTMMTSAPISIQNPPTDGNAWCSDTNSIAITSSTFRANFTAYYNERQNLLNAVSTSYNLKFTEIASDNKITQGEKSSLYIEWKTIYEEKPGITTQGTNASVSTTNYTNAYNTLVTYLTSTPLSMPANPTTDNGNTWCSDVTTITVVGTTFRANFASYYSERQLLLNAVATSIKSTADTANSTATSAASTAATAQSLANTANSNANTALTQANTAISGLSDKLSKTANTVLSGSGAVIAGTLVINSSGARTSGSGVALTSAGLAGFNSSGTATFAIDTAGNASFAGSLSAASGTFAGTLSSVGGSFTGSLSAATGTFAGSLSAVTGSFGAVALSTTGVGGTFSSGMTGFATGTGWWMDYNSGTPRFSIGTGSAGTISNGLSWNGTTAVFAGSLMVSGTAYATSSFLNSNTTATDVGLGNVSNLTPANQTSTGLNAGTTITGGGITMNAGGTIKGGKTGFADTTNAGFVIGYGTGPSNNQYGFKFGNATMSNGISWDGTSLNMNGGTVVIGSSPTISGTTMTGTGARFEAGGNWCAGNATTNISFNGTTMTLNGNVVANTNIQTDAVSTIKVSANSITNLLTSYWNTSLNPVPSPYLTWNLFHSYSFTCPTVGDATTTLTGLFQVVVNTWNKNTTAGNVSRIQIGIGLSKDSTPTTPVRGSSSSMYMVAADGVDPVADYYGLDYPATTDAYVSEIWTSSLTQGTAYTVKLFYYISSTSGPRAVLDHASINITFLKR